jgi:hypothetical protein
MALRGADTAPGATASRPTPSWIERPMRWAQLTLVEDDPAPGKLDVPFWIDYVRRIKADGVCLSAGGCVAYYPTAIAGHHRSAWLGDRDVFGELVAGCRKLGMVVVARTDPHATYDDVRNAHPDWIHTTADGQLRRHWASPEMWVTCALGPYNFEFMTAVKREIVSCYRVDAIFINRWDGSGQCFCPHCRENFRAASGFELPRTDNPRDPARRAYIQWRQQRLMTLWQTWDEAVRAINPDACVVPNNGTGGGSPMDGARVGAIAPMLVADRQARHGTMPPWAFGKSVKEFRAVMGAKPVAGLFGVGLEEPYRWKDSVQNPAEIQLWLADGIANGARPWLSKFAGTLYDPRWLKPVEEMYGWCAANEKYLRNTAPLARVAVVYSQQTSWYYRSERLPRDVVDDATLGWCQALIEARIPFEMVHDRQLAPERLKAFKTLILPNTAALSDAQCEQLRTFVQAGGGLVATLETSRCNEFGEPRADFGLAELFGASTSGVLEGPMRNGYLELRHKEFPQHPLLAGLEDAPRTIHGVWRLEVTPRGESKLAPLTLIPPYADLPMEKVYPREPHTNIAQVFSREVGAGRVAYFPWDIDRTFWEVMDVDHGKLMHNAVNWVTGEPPSVEVTGPGVLDVTLWRQRGSYTVHLVNLTNPMMMKGPVREIIPVGAQRVRLRIAGLDKTVRSARLLVAGKSVAVSPQSGALECVVPEIGLHEVIAFEA